MVQSFQNIRYFIEKWSWVDPRYGIRTMGLNPPENAVEKKQVPVFVKYVTGHGHLEQGMVINLKSYPRLHQRLVKFVASGECRRLRDYLIIEIDGTRFITH